MTEIFVKVNNATAVATRTDILTSGMVGVPVHFTFDKAWDGLVKTAVFQCGDVVKDRVLDNTGKTTVPYEVLAEAGGKVYVGVEGRDADGNLVLPTVMVFIGRTRVGADPFGDESTDPSLPVWAQIIATGAISSTQINEAGELEITLLNGETVNVGQVVGRDGEKGEQGEPGYTPVKGTDYYTEEDKTEMVNSVLAALPIYSGEVVEE